MFCMRALVAYAEQFEQTPPDFTVAAKLEDRLFGQTRFSDWKDPPVTFERPIQPQDPGRKTKVVIERRGKGRLYYSTRVTFAPIDDHAERQNAGIDLHREYSVERGGQWVLLKNPTEIRRGELVRVDLFVSLPTARNFVVVDDPVPGGLEPVNRELATASKIDADKGAYPAAGGSWWFQFDDWQYFNVSRWTFYHQEIRHNSVRYYSDYLPPGNYHLAYTAQAIATGRFAIMPAHAEEMYDPDIFGKGLPAALQVDPAREDAP